jgi:hypothetical protein
MPRWLKSAVLLPAVSSEPGSAQTVGIDQMAWMQGCWEQASGDWTVEEQWMAPRGGK